MPHPIRLLALHRVELWASSGEQLKTFALDECEGAPHEFRGVTRGELLAALRSAVPAESIMYDCPVNVVHALEEGWSQACMLCAQLGSLQYRKHCMALQGLQACSLHAGLEAAASCSCA